MFRRGARVLVGTFIVPETRIEVSVSGIPVLAGARVAFRTSIRRGFQSTDDGVLLAEVVARRTEVGD